MKRFFKQVIGILVLVFPLSGLAREQEKTPVVISTSKGGIEVASFDGLYAFELGGCLLLDIAYYNEDRNDLGDGTEVRRALIDMEGSFAGDWDYAFELDFSGDQTEIQDAWLAYAGKAPFLFKAGQFKEPLGLENLTGLKNITFMERALVDELTPGRNLGLGVLFSGKRGTGAAGIFGQDANDDVEKEGDEGWGITGRMTFAPMAAETRAIHLGGAASRRKVDDEGVVRFKTEPESRVTDIEFLDTGKIKKVDHLWTYGLEGLGVYGPFSVQSEWIQTRVNQKEAITELAFSGWYVSGSWFITGESRPYDPEEGRVKGVEPKQKMGALELAARFSRMDLSDRKIRGGTASQKTLGMNWYLNSNIRLAANYSLVDNDQEADGGDELTGNDDPSIFQARVQVVF